MKKQKVHEYTEQDVELWQSWPKNKFFRLALAQLHRENHPWVYYEGISKDRRAVYGIDEDNPNFNFKKMWCAILITMSKIVRAYNRNHARIEVKLYDRLSK